MTAQEKGLIAIAGVVRQMVPPQLDFVVICYMPEGELKISSSMSIRANWENSAGLARAREACKAFIENDPREDFDPKS
jgi:hypothetical protein